MSQQPEKFEGSSASISDEQKAKLKSLFPEIITEGGKIDFDRLKLTLGESGVKTSVLREAGETVTYSAKAALQIP